MITDRSGFTVTQLKNILKAKGLNTAGLKYELIDRLEMNDPTDAWMEEKMNDGAGASANENSDVGAAASANSPRSSSHPTMDARSVDILQEERKLAEREIQLLRREVEMMREMQRLNIGGQFASPSTARVNESMRAMLSYFDGSDEAFDAWEGQLALLRTTYRLGSDATKLLAVSCLKDQALEWFHSKPEHIGMPIDDLMKELRDIFGDRVHRIAARREFERQTWKREETFAEYTHRKMILANRIRIGEEELIEYLTDGIPDHSLRNHAKLRKLKSRASLLEAFRRVTLPPTADVGSAWMRIGGKARYRSAGKQECRGSTAQRSTEAWRRDERHQGLTDRGNPSDRTTRPDGGTRELSDAATGQRGTAKR